MSITHIFSKINNKYKFSHICYYLFIKTDKKYENLCIKKDYGSLD